MFQKLCTQDLLYLWLKFIIAKIRKVLKYKKLKVINQVIVTLNFLFLIQFLKNVA